MDQLTFSSSRTCQGLHWRVEELGWILRSPWAKLHHTVHIQSLIFVMCQNIGNCNVHKSSTNFHTINCKYTHSSKLLLDCMIVTTKICIPSQQSNTSPVHERNLPVTKHGTVLDLCGGPLRSGSQLIGVCCAVLLPGALSCKSPGTPLVYHVVISPSIPQASRCCQAVDGTSSSS